MRRSLGLLVAAVLAGNPVPGYGYRFFPGPEIEDIGRVIVPSDQALRWGEHRRDIEFRILVNDNLPADIEVTDELWASIVQRSIAQWDEIPTAEIRVTLGDAPVALGKADAGDGHNTIGFSDDDLFVDSWVSGFAALRVEDGEIRGCDIEMNPRLRKNWEPSRDPLELLRILTIHEVGHCLGLDHTEPHPMPLWTELPVTVAGFFRPDPVMSYSNSYRPLPTPDEITGVSLLYPAAGYAAAHASVEGTVTRDGNPVAYGYVLAVPTDGSDPNREIGPGVFTDRNGAFLLEGLPPGDWMLWIHPFLVVRRLAHGRMEVLAEETGSRDFPDQWRWIRVEAGDRMTGLDIRVRTGRRRLR